MCDPLRGPGNSGSAVLLHHSEDLAADRQSPLARSLHRQVDAVGIPEIGIVTNPFQQAIEEHVGSRYQIHSGPDPLARQIPFSLPDLHDLALPEGMASPLCPPCRGDHSSPEHSDQEQWPELLRDLIHREQIRLVFLSHCQYGYERLGWLHEQVQHRFAAVDYLHIEERNWGRGGFVGLSADAAPFLTKTYTSSRTLRERVLEKYERNPAAVEAAPIYVDALDAYDPNQVSRGQIRRRDRLFRSVPA